MTRIMKRPSRPLLLTNIHTLLALLCVVAIATGCSSDSVSTSDDAETTTSETTTSASTPLTTATTTTTTAATTMTTVATTLTEPSLPGEELESFPQSGDLLAVVGVAHDDVLNVRELPGIDQDIIATLSPTANSAIATGRARALPSSIWYELTVDGETGWSSSSFLAFLGGTDDATAEFLDGSELPQAETMVQLADIVAAEFASQEPASEIVQTVAPTVGDLGEITYDVIGIGDDSVIGFRLHIFATPLESGEGFGLGTIERTTLCGRGVTDELCR